MALRDKKFIQAELDLMAQELENKGNAELASLVDEVASELMTEQPVTAKAKAKKKPAAKSNKKRKKSKKRKEALAKTSTANRAEVKRVLKAAHAELLDISSELLKEGDLKTAKELLRYAEEVKEEEDNLDLMSDMPAPEADEMDEEPSEEGEDLNEPAEDGEEEGEEDDDDSDDDSDDGAMGMEDEPAGDEPAEGEDEEEVSDEDIEAMLRKYELGEDMAPEAPKAPEAPEPPKAPEAPEVPGSSDEDKDDEGEEDDEGEDKDDEGDEKSEGDEPEDKTADALFDLAKKLAAAGEKKLAFAIAEILDKKDK